jgi:hypothetical protein
MVEMVPSQERIASPLIDIESSTTGHKYFDLLPGRVIEPFQESLPPGILVNFVQADSRFPLRRGEQRSLPKILGVFDQEPSMAFNVPVEIERFHPDPGQKMLGEGCLADLSRACNEGHLGLFSKKPSDFGGKITHQNVYI